MAVGRKRGGPWARRLWIAAGVTSLVLGAIGIVLPLMPTVPFVILAAFCFSKGSAVWERWMLRHPRLGPIVRDWREHHAIPRGAKILATLMMASSCAMTWYFVPEYAWWPTGICALVAAWLWYLPSRR
jgi:uncharacterized membrane protein YbaN (DUF454 family)